MLTKLNKIPAKFQEFAATFPAMNTDVELLIYTRVRQGQKKLAQERFNLVLGRIQLLFSEVETSLSRFREDSELSRLNRQGHITNASHLLFSSVRAALTMADYCDGIFDPTILAALENAGYNRSFELLGQAPALLTGKISYSVFKGYQGVKLDPVLKAISLPYATRLDLGGIAKGMSVDLASELLRKAGFHNFMLSAGGDMVVSGYCANGTQHLKEWEVGVLNPLTLSGNLASLTLSNQAVATSAITKRRWQMGRQLYNHLIDPRSGQPVDNGLAAVTVVAPTAQLADVLAKTALILGLEEGRVFLRQQKGCFGFFVTLDGQFIPSSSLATAIIKD